MIQDAKFRKERMFKGQQKWEKQYNDFYTAYIIY